MQTGMVKASTARNGMAVFNKGKPRKGYDTNPAFCRAAGLPEAGALGCLQPDATSAEPINEN
jgi:hypothetical protein